MKFLEYIELLSESKLKKENFDKILWFSPTVPRSTTEYEQAVLDGYRWSIQDYKSEYTEKTDITKQKIDIIINKIHTLDQKINEVSNSIPKKTKDKTKDIQSMFDSQETSIQSLWEKLEAYKRLLDEEPQAIKEHRELLKSIQQQIKNVQKEVKKVEWSIPDLSDILTQLKKLQEKTNDTTQYTKLKDNITTLQKTLQEKATFDEVKTALKVFTTKDEVLENHYTKKQIDSKIKNIKQGDILVAKWWGWWGTWTTTRAGITDKPKLLSLKYQSYTFTKVDNKIDTITYADWTITEFMYIDNVLTTAVTTFIDTTVITVTYTDTSVTYS